RGEGLLADAGFTGLEDSDCMILTISPKDGPISPLFSKYRVTVENTHEMIRNFQVCKAQLRYWVDKYDTIDDILKMHHIHWVIGAALVNQFYNK
ncbi:MAG TPA: hypothetical protein VFC05_02855, partial [Nitrososphaeraceae archaeon]|nr:hypothetical protein [Nitrososphaeraceae archaeon]